MLKKTSSDLIFVNDASTDNGYELLKIHTVNVISLTTNLGIGGCIQTGYIYAKDSGYDIAIQYDGDGRHVAKYASSLIDTINNGYDYAIGSRYVKSIELENGFQSTKLRLVGIKVLSFLIRILAGKQMRLPTI